MSIYAISDLHLACSIDKPMDIFGGRWNNYMEKLKAEWENYVTEGDCVVIPGDISWATYIDQAFEDFNFLQSLPGMKIISKGNHDYWWTTLKKLQEYVTEKDFSTIRFMHNNHYLVENTLICGTRGWKCPGEEDFNGEDRKIYAREVQRLELSLKSIPSGNTSEIVVAMHYPPFNPKGDQSDFIEVMKKYQVDTCIYGHLHGDSCKYAVEGKIDEIDFICVSADHLHFKPLKLK